MVSSLFGEIILPWLVLPSLSCLGSSYWLTLPIVGPKDAWKTGRIQTPTNGNMFLLVNETMNECHA
jgi:hypothetical protein